MSTVTLNLPDVAAAAARLRATLPPVRDALAVADAATRRATSSASADLASVLSARARDVATGVGALTGSVQRLADGLDDAAGDLAGQDSDMGRTRRLPAGRVQ